MNATTLSPALLHHLPVTSCPRGGQVRAGGPSSRCRLATLATASARSSRAETLFHTVLALAALASLALASGQVQLAAAQWPLFESFVRTLLY